MGGLAGRGLVCLFPFSIALRFHADGHLALVSLFLITECSDHRDLSSSTGVERAAPSLQVFVTTPTSLTQTKMLLAEAHPFPLPAQFTFPRWAVELLQ